MTPAECNYYIYDKELLAIIRCLEHWRADLEGTDDTIKIYTDHQGLMYFAESQELTRRQVRYLDILLEFNIRVIFRLGPRNAKADTLTRLPGSRPVNTEDERVQHQRQTILTPDRLELDGITISAVEDPIFHRIAEANRTNEDIADMRQAITEGKQSLGFLKLQYYTVHNGVLYYKNRLIVPQYMQVELIREAYDQPLCGHPSIHRTCELLKREYYWVAMKKIVARYVRNYYVYQRSKAPRDRAHGLLQPLPVPQQRWQDLTTDFITGLPLSEGFDAIWVVVCRLSKERHYVPCTASDEGTSAESTAMMLIREVFRLHRLPASIISDRGPQFIATVWKSFCKRLGISAKLSTAFHPKTDG